ncbi:general substrate transporter [Rhexocercosporidium sp. MPI-PUGE-AT-0058]|nr:general substrate transporter [Rhexocercosporidium sp. MPI-PUGE-AT-0058]
MASVAAQSVPRVRAEAPITFKCVVICSFAAFGGILFGYDSGYINGILAMNKFHHDFGVPSNDANAFGGYLLPSYQKSLMTSILSLGTFLGALVAGWAADSWGRRNTNILGCVIYIVGVVLQTVAEGSVGLLTAGRAVGGLGVGFVSATVIMYVSEITPKSIRGRVVGGYQFAITIGIFLSACVNLGTKDRTDTGAYRIPIALQFAWALILGVGLCFFPESPRYFVMKGNGESALKSLARLRGQPIDSSYVTDEHDELVESWNQEIAAGAGSGGFGDCFKGGLRKGSNLHRTLIGTSVQVVQQLTGVNFIFYFGTSFFKTIGIKNAFIISIILGAVNVASTPVAFWTIDKWGRRPLLIWGALGMSLCEFVVAIVGTTTGDSSAAHKTLIAFVCVYIFFFASTWGPTGWAVSGEVFPLTIRSKGIALSTASNWLLNFVIAFVTPYFVDEDKADLGSKVFFIWGSTCACAVVYAYAVVYETKGLSLESCDRMMRQVHPWQSAGWRDEVVGIVGDVEGALGANVQGTGVAAAVPAPEAPPMREQRRSWSNVFKRGSTSSSESGGSKEK